MHGARCTNMHIKHTILSCGSYKDCRGKLMELRNRTKPTDIFFQSEVKSEPLAMLQCAAVHATERSCFAAEKSLQSLDAP